MSRGVESGARGAIDGRLGPGASLDCWARAGSAVCGRDGGMGGAGRGLLTASSSCCWRGVGDGSESLHWREEREVQGEVEESNVDVRSCTFKGTSLSCRAYECRPP